MKRELDTDTVTDVEPEAKRTAATEPLVQADSALQPPSERAEDAQDDGATSAPFAASSAASSVDPSAVQSIGDGSTTMSSCGLPVTTDGSVEPVAPLLTSAGVQQQDQVHQILIPCQKLLCLLQCQFHLDTLYPKMF